MKEGAYLKMTEKLLAQAARRMEFSLPELRKTLRELGMRED
jgi:uncharacterized protein (UPF0216 family)